VALPDGDRPPDPASRRLVRLALVREDDQVLLDRYGLIALRRGRLMRLCTQALEQGALLGYADLAHLLSTSASTLKRDVRAIERAGIHLPLVRWKHAGRRKVAGLLAPAAAVRLALDGLAPQEIAARLWLTESQVLDWCAACRAVRQLAAEGQLPEAIAQATGHSLPLVRDFLRALGGGP
jgi:predicted DNA-binding transcriptional regulator YafY